MTRHLVSAAACAALLLLPDLGAQQREVLRTGDVVAETWSAPAADGEVLPWFRFSLDGGQSWSRERATSYDILLRYAEFDPLADGEPEIPATLADPGDGGLYIVQYAVKGLEPWRDEIRAMGAVDHRFLGNHANVWRMDAATAKQVADLPFVRWVGAFHPAYKLEDELMNEFDRGALLQRRYNFVVGEWGPAEKAQLVPMIQELGGTVHEAYETGWIVSATVSPAALLTLVHSPLVLGVDRWGAPETDMDNGRVLFGSNYVETAGGYTGAGVNAEVMDGNLDTSHVDWTNAPVLTTGTGGDASHGTCTYGINFADGDSAAGSTRGVMPDANGHFADYSNYGNRYTHTQNIVNNRQVVYQSNSWGSSRTASYNSISQEMDDIIFDLDISICQSQSNAGNQQSRPQAWAKNIIAVGGVRHYNNQNWADDAWAGGGSIGPAQDGRIKPDLASWYDNIWTSDADPGGYTGGDDYTNFGGTSGATPIVAGHLGLIYQMWADAAFGNQTNGNPLDVFGNRPHNTTAKALLLNSTRQWNFTGTGSDLTRTHQGWGAPDVARLYDNRAKTLVVDEDVILADGDVAGWTVTVGAGQPELRATMIYSDLPGTTSSSLHRINDLTLRVTAPNGDVYWGNDGLLGSMYSSANGSANTKDTVEQVIIQNPTAGDWEVAVFADEINQDSHVETPAVDADFSLVVSTVDSWTGTTPQLTNTIALSGPFQPMASGTYGFNFTGAPANGTAWIAWSLNTNGTVFNGQQFDLGAPYTIVGGSQSTGTLGIGGWLLYLPPPAAGVTVYFEVAATAGGVWYDSNALQVDIQ